MKIELEVRDGVVWCTSKPLGIEVVITYAKDEFFPDGMFMKWDKSEVGENHPLAGLSTIEAVENLPVIEI